MTRLLILGLIAAAAVPAAAQQKSVSRADWAKTVDAHFAQLDANHDGILTKAELAAEQQRELAQAKAAVEQQLRAKFNQLDTNKDGQLSIQEFFAIAPALKVMESSDQLLQRLDTNHDGKVTAAEFRGPQIAKFDKADANHDGVVTPAEAQAAGKK